MIRIYLLKKTLLVVYCKALSWDHFISWSILQREARYRFHQTKIFDTFLTLFDWVAGFFRQFEIYSRTRLEITATFLNNHRMNFQEIREKSWSGGNGSALRAVMTFKNLLKSLSFSCLMKTRISYMLTKILGHWN